MRRILPSRTILKLASFASQVLVGVLVALIASTLLNGMRASEKNAAEPPAKFSTRVPGAESASATQASGPRSLFPVATFALIQPPLPPMNNSAEKKVGNTARLQTRETSFASPPPRPKNLSATPNAPQEPVAGDAAPMPESHRVGLLEAVALPTAVLDFNRLAPSGETMASAVGAIKSAFDWVAGDAGR